jgi:hypothetical protein
MYFMPVLSSIEPVGCILDEEWDSYSAWWVLSTEMVACVFVACNLYVVVFKSQTNFNIWRLILHYKSH